MAPNNQSRARRNLDTNPRRNRNREDRDGDVKMGAETAATRGRGGIKKTGPPRGPRDPARAPKGTVTGSLTNSKVQRNLAQAMAKGDLTNRDARSSRRGGMAEFKVTGHEKSAAAHADDKGASAVVTWLESKVSRRLGSAVNRRSVRFKSRIEDGELIVKVPEADARMVERMNGYEWAKTKVYITRVGGADDENQPQSKTDETRAMLQGVLERRYNEQAKLLDLSGLGQDAELQAQAIFDSKSTANKFFAAMMRVLEMAFTSKQELDAAIQSVSLANNDLTDLKAVTTLSATLPKLHNLDLSNNKFENLKALDNWRRRFRQLQHLLVAGNPLEQNEPNYGAELLKWYPNLRMLNDIQVRTEEDIAKAMNTNNIPFPIRSPNFHDEQGIAENFIRTFFAGYDSDRATLATYYYDDKSEFSFSLNTSALRDPAGTVETVPHEWEAYIKASRNLKKLTQLPARQTRLYRGTKAVGDVFAMLPRSQHPDLATEARKWMIEANIQPGIPDPTGQSPHGVDGFSITVNTEYNELDANNQPTKKRSCDHFFQIGPGGPQGVRIVSHLMTVRAYGGAQAFDPEQMANAGAPSPPQMPVEPQLPAGLSIEVAEQMVNELMKQTNMTMAFSKDCLEQVGWDFPRALAAFESVKGTLAPDAFMQVPQA